MCVESHDIKSFIPEMRQFRLKQLQGIKLSFFRSWQEFKAVFIITEYGSRTTK